MYQSKHLINSNFLIITGMILGYYRRVLVVVAMEKKFFSRQGAKINSYILPELYMKQVIWL